MDGVQLPQSQSHFEEAVYFLPLSFRNSWYSFDRPQKDERLSQPWSCPVVLNVGHLDWESSTLTTRPLLHKSTKVQRLLKATTKIWLNKLKRDLSATHESMRYVSKLLHSRIKHSWPKSLTKDHDQEMPKNFWHYCKKFIKTPSCILPEFDKQECSNYFR